MKGIYKVKFDNEKVLNEFADELICYKKKFHGRGFKSREVSYVMELDYYGGPTKYNNVEWICEVIDEEPFTRFLLNKYGFQKIGVA